SLGLPLSEHSFVLRTVNSKIHQFQLGKMTIDSVKYLTAPHFLEKQVDGLFCMEGSINYSRELSRLVYTYQFRNQFICSDTNLTVLYRGKTIDTIHTAQIQVKQIHPGVYTLSAPPLIVNKRARVSGKYLFIQSALRADNEDESILKRASDIDVYDLTSGAYQCSFYLFNQGAGPLLDFYISRQTLIALHDHYLFRYILDPHFFR
ncbi:MAG: hypothetical protein ACJ748_12545, partial [Flavisolibacter sp.]